MATMMIEGLESGNESNDDSDNEPSSNRTDTEPGAPLVIRDNLSISTVLEDQPDQIHDHDESHNTSHNMKLTDFLPADIPAQLQLATDLFKVMEDYFNRVLEKCHLTENITVSELDLTLPSSYESKFQDNINQLVIFFAKIIENICKSKSKVDRVVFPEMRIDLLEGAMRGLENELSKQEIQPQFNEINLRFLAKDKKTLNDDIVGVVEYLLVYKPNEICLLTNDLNSDQRHTALSKKLKETIQMIIKDDKKTDVKLGSKTLVNWKQTKIQDKTKQQKLTKQSTSKKQSSKQKQRGSISEASRKGKILLPKKLKLQDQSQVFAFDFQLMVPYSPGCPNFMTAYEYWNLEKIHNKFQSTGKGVTVAIVDTGISPHHAFVGKDITTMNFSGDLIDTDKIGHGTICAGILCGNSFRCYCDPQNPSDKRITDFPPGVAPDANLVVCKVTSDDSKTATSSAVAEALKWIDDNNREEGKQRIDVVSLSMGSRGISFEVVDAINWLVSNGVIVVCAASNCGHQFSQPICYPARLGNVLCIGSHGLHGKPYSFSPVGQEIDFLGPGEKIAAPNNTIIANHVAIDSGTSYAASAVAGLVCLILEYINHIGAKFGIEVAKQLKNNWVMKEILRKMSTCPGRHTDDEGFGALNPLQFFQRPDHIIEMIDDEVINPDSI